MPTETPHSIHSQSWLGKRGQWVANFSVMFLFYALCAAYIAGGGAQPQEKLNNGLSMSLAPQVGSVVLAIVIGTVVTLGTSKAR